MSQANSPYPHRAKSHGLDGRYLKGGIISLHDHGDQVVLFLVNPVHNECAVTQGASHSKFFAVYLTPSADLVNGSIEAERACSLALYPADKGLAAHSRAHITFGQVLATGTGRPNWRRTRGRTAIFAVPNRYKCTRFVRGHVSPHLSQLALVV